MGPQFTKWLQLVYTRFPGIPKYRSGGAAPTYRPRRRHSSGTGDPIPNRPDSMRFPLPRLLAGRDSLNCGLTRAFLATSRFDFLAAFSYHPPISLVEAAISHPLFFRLWKKVPVPLPDAASGCLCRTGRATALLSVETESACTNEEVSASLHRGVRTGNRRFLFPSGTKDGSQLQRTKKKRLRPLLFSVLCTGQLTRRPPRRIR